MSKSIQWNPSDCPEWCKAGTKEYPCHGEHMRLSSSNGWVPATGGIFNNADALSRPGTTVSTGLYWAEAWGGGIEVNLNINSEDVDEQANLKIGEAIRLTRELVMVIEAVAFEGTLFEDGEVLGEIASTATDIVAFVKARRS